MANTRVQHQIEDSIRENELPKLFSQHFRKSKLPLRDGGEFEFDAVSDDNRIVANISTSSGTTVRGKYPAGKVQKIRADILFLTMVQADKKIIVFTEKDMYDLFMMQKKRGRVPKEIDLEYAILPESISYKLKDARNEASEEVTPR